MLSYCSVSAANFDFNGAEAAPDLVLCGAVFSHLQVLLHFFIAVMYGTAHLHDYMLVRLLEGGQGQLPRHDQYPRRGMSLLPGLHLPTLHLRLHDMS